MNSQFNGDSAFSGGGFMPSQVTQTTDSGFVSTKNRETQRLIPVTVKQINDAYVSSEDKSNLVVDGVDVNNITMVGMVFNKTERVTEVSFSLDDGTGRLECHRWMNEGIDAKEMEEVQDGMYVRIHGHLKGFHGRTHFVVFSVRPITNFNDIAYHFIECVYVHVYNTKSQKVQSTANAQPQMTNQAMGMNGSTVNQYAAQYGFDAPKGLEKKVLDYLCQPAVINRETGASLEELAQYLKVTLENIMESIRFLEAEGTVYSTIDDKHYKSAVNG